MFLAVLELLKLGQMHVKQDSVYDSMVLYSGKGKPVKDLQTEMDTEGISVQGSDVS
jgi:segregation and condensation protein A